MAIFYPSPNIRHKIVDERAVLLDLRAGVYVVLDRVATAMWDVSLCIGDPAQRIIALERQFDAPAVQLETDLAAFTRDCVAKGFLQHSVAVFVERNRRLRIHHSALTLRAWWTLLSTTNSLARQGFERTYGEYFRFAKPLVNRGQSDILISRAERAFARAENFFVMRTAPKDCLPRSLALYRFLLSVGVAADHCIGVHRFPFEAHAWVECHGRVLLDSPDFVRKHVELARM